MPRDSHSDNRVHPTLILLVLSLAGLAYAVLSSAVIPALPSFQHDLHTTETGVTWLLTGFLLSASVGTSIIGRLGDMYGKERLLLWTLRDPRRRHAAGGGLDSLGVLIVARVIQGVGGRHLPARVLDRPRRVPAREGRRQHRPDVLDPRHRRRLSGSSLGALIVEHLGWHWLFWIPLVVTLLAAVCTWRFIPESPVRVAGQGQLARRRADERRDLLPC